MSAPHCVGVRVDNETFYDGRPLRRTNSVHDVYYYVMEK